MNLLRIGLMSVFFILTAVVFAACSEDGEEGTIRFSSDSFAFDMTGGEQTITVNTGGIVWEARIEGDHAQWFTFSYSQSEGIRIIAPTNTDAEIKRATVLVAIGSARVDIPVIQNRKISEAPPSLSVIPEVSSVQFRSSGGRFTATVHSDSDWTATVHAKDGDASDTGWIMVTEDKEKCLVHAVAGEYSGDQARVCTLVITATETPEVKYSVDITQVTRNEDMYLLFSGEWDLYSDKWYYYDEFVGAGTYSSCTIEVKAVNDTYTLKDMIQHGMELEIYFNPDNNTIGIPLGWLVNRSNDLYFYLSQISIDSNKRKQVEQGYITGSLSEDGNRIELTGFKSGYGICIAASDGQQMLYVADLYYAVGQEIRLDRKQTRNSAMFPEDHYYTFDGSVGKSCVSYQYGFISGVLAN